MKKSDLKNIIRREVKKLQLQEQGAGPRPYGPSSTPTASKPTPQQARQIFNQLGNPQTYEQLSSTLVDLGVTPQAISRITKGQTGRIEPRAIPWLAWWVIRYGGAAAVGAVGGWLANEFFGSGGP